MSRHRSYCFTINNYTAKDIDKLLDAYFKYMCFGFEVGKDDTPHIQGYIQYYTTRSFAAIKKDIPRAHIEISKGSPMQNIEYCSKDGEFYEFGERPTEGGRVTYDQIEAAMKDPKNNATIIRQYAKTYEQIKQLEIKNKQVQTKYYVIKPDTDAIQEIQEYFGDINLSVVVKIDDLAIYDDVDNVVLYEEYPERKTTLYPRGMPITYKYGYEIRHVKPEKFIIVTDTPNLYPLYKNIII